MLSSLTALCSAPDWLGACRMHASPAPRSRDEYDVEYDRGKTKKLRTHEPSPLSRGNAFQKAAQKRSLAKRRPVN